MLTLRSRKGTIFGPTRPSCLPLPISVAGEVGGGLPVSPGLLPPLPLLSPLSSPGLDCFTPSPGNRQARTGRHFLTSPRGEGAGEGEGQGGGAKSGLATATASELAGRSAPGSSTVREVRARGRGSICARGRGGAGVPGLLPPRAAPDMPRTPCRTPARLHRLRFGGLWD